MKKYCFLLFFHIAAGHLFAQQQHDNNWFFAFSGDTATVIIFGEDSLHLLKNIQPLNLRSSNGTISNIEGQLMFYSNGCEIYNYNFAQIENGFGLNPGSIASDNCHNGYTGGHQSIVILPSLQDEEIKENKIQSIGPTIFPLDEILQTILSPKGDLYVRAFADRGIFLYDFDRDLGELSNPRHIDFAIEPKFGGAAVSANGRFLYVNSLLELWQFDLEADDIEASKVLIATYDGYASPFASTFYKAQIGPDCKLYYNSNNGEDVLHVMHNPNVKGTACNFEQHGIQLYSSHGISLPYFPSFRLDSDYPICDTTRLVATSIQLPVRSPMQVWAIAPNPTGGRFSLATNLPLRYDAQVFIYNASGQLVLQKEMSSGEKAMELNLDGFGSGVYFYQVIGEKGVYGSGRVVKN